MCAPAREVSNSSVPSLQEDASNWRALSGHVTGMQPEMVVVADLLLCTDDYITSQLNECLEAHGLEAVAHVSTMFSRMKSKFIQSNEADTLRVAGSMFFARFDLDLSGMEQQWDLAMKWRSKRVAFAHPLLGANGVIDMKRLDDLESDVKTKPGFAQVRQAMEVMIKVARQLLAGS